MPSDVLPARYFEIRSRLTSSCKSTKTRVQIHVRGSLCREVRRKQCILHLYRERRTPRHGSRHGLVLHTALTICTSASTWQHSAGNSARRPAKQGLAASPFPMQCPARYFTARDGLADIYVAYFLHILHTVKRKLFFLWCAGLANREQRKTVCIAKTLHNVRTKCKTHGDHHDGDTHASTALALIPWRYGHSCRERLHRGPLRTKKLVGGFARWGSGVAPSKANKASRWLRRLAGSFCVDGAEYFSGHRRVNFPSAGGRRNKTKKHEGIARNRWKKTAQSVFG